MERFEGDLIIDHGYVGIEDITVGDRSLRDYLELYQFKKVKITVEIIEDTPTP